ASDDNSDSLSFTLHIRGAGESEWKLLREKIRERWLSWDSTAYPDGHYRLRVTASDAPSNPPAQALAAAHEGEPFLIDNTPPRIAGLTATRASAKLTARWKAADALAVVARAEYSLDGGDWTLVAPASRVSDSLELDYEVTLDAPPGEHTLAIRVQDAFDNQSTEKIVVR
ncbi:MAG: hypothetical protein ACRD96_01390, partial [Bryobacteraceae bacterium]